MVFTCVLGKYWEREDDLRIYDLTALSMLPFFLTLSSRDVKLKKFLEVSLLHCCFLGTSSMCSICAAQFQCLLSVRATRSQVILNIMDRRERSNSYIGFIFHDQLLKPSSQ